MEFSPADVRRKKLSNSNSLVVFFEAITINVTRHTLHITLAWWSTRISSPLQRNLSLNVGGTNVCENRWVLGHRNFNNIYSTFDKQAKQFNTMGDVLHTIHFFSFHFFFWSWHFLVFFFYSLRDQLKLSMRRCRHHRHRSKWRRFERQHELNWKRKLKWLCWRRRESNFTLPKPTEQS